MNPRIKAATFDLPRGVTLDAISNDARFAAELHVHIRIQAAVPDLSGALVRHIRNHRTGAPIRTLAVVAATVAATTPNPTTNVP